VSSLFIETAGRQVLDGLWAEVGKLGQLWLHLVSWLIAENGRALASLSMPLAPWFVLLLIVAGRALLPTFADTCPGTQRPTGGTR